MAYSHHCNEHQASRAGRVLGRRAHDSSTLPSSTAEEASAAGRTLARYRASRPRGRAARGDAALRIAGILAMAAALVRLLESER